MTQPSPHSQICIIFTICLLGEGISYLLPFTFPASVISMLLMVLFLLSGLVKEGQIAGVSDFLLTNMGIFYVPSCIGVMNYFDLIAQHWLAVLVICALTTPLIYAVTAWTVQWTMKWMDKGDR